MIQIENERKLMFKDIPILVADIKRLQFHQPNFWVHCPLAHSLSQPSLTGKNGDVMVF
jgi:hypothetical protein